MRRRVHAEHPTRRQRHARRQLNKRRCVACQRRYGIDPARWPDPRIPLLAVLLCRTCRDRVAYWVGWVSRGPNWIRTRGREGQQVYGCVQIPDQSRAYRTRLK